MKVRTGFVSNSSTSSFCIFGISFKDIKEIAGIFNVSIPEPTIRKEKGCQCIINRDAAKFCPNCGRQTWIAIQVQANSEDAWEFVEKQCIELGLEFHRYDGSIYVGGMTNHTGQAAINELTEINNKLLATFGKEGSFHSGEYAC